MEIASVLPIGVAAAEAGPTRGQAPEERFCDCLGTAVGREPGAKQPPPRAGGLEETAAAGDPRSAAAMVGEEPETERGIEEPEDEPALAAAIPAPATPPVAVTPSPEPDAPVVFVSEAGAAEPPPAPPPPPTEQVPPVSPPEHPHATAPGGVGAAPPAPSDPLRPTAPANPKHPLDPVAAAPSRAAIAAPGVMQQTAPVPESAAPAPERAAPAHPTDIEPEGDGVRSGNSRGRFGAERLWGYWLRHGGGGAQRAAAVPGAEAPAVSTGAETAGDAAQVRESSQWLTLMEAAPGGAGRGPGTGTTAVPEPRAEPIPVTASPDPGSGAARGPERTAPAGSSTPRVPSPPPQPPHQIANAVRVAVLRGGDRVTVQLEPEALGKVQVVLVHGDEGVRASFRVENPLTHQALQTDAPQLKLALEARGVNVAHISVELEQGDRQGRDPLGRQSQGRRRRLGGADDGEMQLDDLPLRPEQWRPWGFEARA